MPSQSSNRWWSRRPWVDSLTMIDTVTFEPGRPRSVPLLPSARPRRTKPTGNLMPLHSRPVQAADRRGHEAFGILYRALQLPASARLVALEEAERLERARSAIAFRPKHGFLHSTPIGRLARRASHSHGEHDHGG
jgi:hypothetical protein